MDPNYYSRKLRGQAGFGRRESLEGRAFRARGSKIGELKSFPPLEPAGRPPPAVLLHPFDKVDERSGYSNSQLLAECTDEFLKC